MRRLCCLLAFLACLGPSIRAAAQETPPVAPADGSPAAPATDGTAGAAAVGAQPTSDQAGQGVVLDPHAPARTEVTLDRKTQAVAGIGFAGPIGAAASLRLLHGLGADVRDDGTRVKAVCAVPLPHCAQGFLLQADVGTGGGKLSLGLGARARIDDDDFHGSAGVALRLALARTWGNPVGTEPGLTYLGPELDLSVIRVNLTLGVLFRVAGDGRSGALFSWGLGFGL